MGREDDLWTRRFQASQRRHQLKAWGVEALGGKCRICGYDRLAGLQFHHLDPREKDFNLGSRVSGKAWEAELKKCVLVCANCHAEIHAGYYPQYVSTDALDEVYLWLEAPTGNEGLLDRTPAVSLGVDTSSGWNFDDVHSVVDVLDEG